jgi:magnesium transporter
MQRRELKKSEPHNFDFSELIPLGDNKNEPTKVRFFTYNKNFYEEKPFLDSEDIDIHSIDHVNWLHIEGLGNKVILKNLSSRFNLHPLLIEDIISGSQSPKVDDWDNFIYITLRHITFNDKFNNIIDEQFSIVVGHNFVISFLEKQSTLFDSVIERLKSDKGIIRKQNSDFLSYVLMDTVLDNYFVILEKIGAEIEMLEDYQAKHQNGQKILPHIHHIRREVIILRKAAWPLREVISKLQRDESSDIFSSITKFYLRDIYDHSIQIIDTIDAFRDLSRGLLDVAIAQMSYKMNEVIKILTVVGTIFIPLTFITSYYGMNFEYMPELNWRYGYLMIVIVMVILTLFMWRYFKRKNWF